MVWLKEWIWVVMNDASWENELMEVKQRHSVCYKCEMIIWCLSAVFQVDWREFLFY